VKASKDNADFDVKSSKGSEKKKKDKKTPLKDSNGNELKRPLSAYMLFNNYRRPVLRAEHPGKKYVITLG
jgi:hypothetical protein